MRPVMASAFAVWFAESDSTCLPMTNTAVGRHGLVRCRSIVSPLAILTARAYAHCVQVGAQARRPPSQGGRTPPATALLLEAQTRAEVNSSKKLRATPPRHEACFGSVDMNVLKTLTIVLVLVVGVAVLLLCGDGIGVGCGHACCAGSERSRPLQRLARRLKCVCRSFMDLLLLMGGFTRGTYTSCASLASTPALLKVAALRI